MNDPQPLIDAALALILHDEAGPSDPTFSPCVQDWEIEYDRRYAVFREAAKHYRQAQLTAAITAAERAEDAP